MGLVAHEWLSDSQVQDAQQLLHSAPGPDLRADVWVLAQLDQNPDHTPQQLEVLRVEQAEKHWYALVHLHLLPHLSIRTEESQQLCSYPKGDTQEHAHTQTYIGMHTNIHM